MFWKNKTKKISNNIDIVSIHIPKTAGTSFRNILKSHFGDNAVVRLDIKPGKKLVLLENQLLESEKLSEEIKIIHGHMYFKDIANIFELHKKVKYITWLRDPVERVISNYFYLKSRLEEELDEESKGLNILSKMQRTLIEYARDNVNRNRMSKFLKGAEISKFDFVGIMEHYNQDLDYFAELIGIKEIHNFHHNPTSMKKDVPEDIRKEIEELNHDDIELYQNGIELRLKRTAV